MANPVLNERMLNGERVLTEEPMTVNGTINKTLILFAFLLLGSLGMWHLFNIQATDKIMAFSTGALITSIVSFIVIIVNKSLIKLMAPIYAISEGVLIGGASLILEQAYPGIAIQAVSLTMLALFSMLALFKAGLIKCSEKFRSVIFISTLSICGIYLINFIGHFFNMQIPFLFTSSPIGIGFSLIVVGIAALNLIIDFDFIEKGSQYFLPKNMEWYGAFGLMVTLVWLYIEIINLLAKLRDRQ